MAAGQRHATEHALCGSEAFARRLPGIEEIAEYLDDTGAPPPFFKGGTFMRASSAAWWAMSGARSLMDGLHPGRPDQAPSFGKGGLGRICF
jgi:hypothetical protein